LDVRTEKPCSIFHLNGPNVAARARVEPTTLRLKVIDSTKAPYTLYIGGSMRHTFAEEIGNVSLWTDENNFQLNPKKTREMLVAHHSCEFILWSNMVIIISRQTAVHLSICPSPTRVLLKYLQPIMLSKSDPSYI